MKKMLFTTMVCIGICSSAIAQNKVVVVPLIGAEDATGDAVEADVVKGKTFSNATEIGLTGTRPVLPVGKTGQTTPYASGDDGDLEKGYTWPNPRFTDNLDGTITDNATGLIWLTNANCPNSIRDWATALADVVQLNTDGTMNGNACGDTSNGGSHQLDWRLPNIEELHSLTHYGFYSPAVPNTTGTGKWSAGDPFASLESNYYWSSTSYAGGPANFAFTVYMDRGYVGIGNKAQSTTFYVLPVRGGG